MPVQRGNFIEFRTGMINVSPIGRNCSSQERSEFVVYNSQNKVLESFKDSVEKEFSCFNLRFAIGGQISFDCFPEGWDKTYCLQFLNDYDNVFFFGDKTSKGGNDYEISIDNGVTHSRTVTGPTDTIKFVSETITQILGNTTF